MELNMGLYAWDTGVLVAILGMLTVFAVLIIIMMVLMIMERIFAKNSLPKKTEVKEKTPEVKPEVKAEVVPVKKADDGELVAVITAAIAASLGVPQRSLKIKSFKRVGKGWTEASRQENIYNNL